MTTTIQAPPLHRSQREVYQHTARFKILSCGRRWGKTLLGCSLCTETAIDKGRAWWIAPSFPMSKVGWRGLKDLAYQIPGAEIRESDKIITYPGGGTAQVRSADDPQSLRGEGLNLAVFDEFAFTKAEAWTEAIRPSLADRMGKALFISTPKGHNLFWDLWRRGQEGHPDWQSWQFPSSSNPYLNAAEIDEARRTSPERIFRQEWLAEFIADAGGVFRRVAEAATATEQWEAEEGHEYAIGVDWGKHNDFTVLTVMDVTTQEEAYIDRFNQIDYTVQRTRLLQLAHRFRDRKTGNQPRIIAEANSIGDPNIEDLEKEGLEVEPFQTTNATKKVIVEALALAFENGTIKILPDPVAVGECQAFEVKRTPSGLFTYAAPDGMHDDCVISKALAWQAVAAAPKGGFDWL